MSNLTIGSRRPLRGHCLQLLIVAAGILVYSGLAAAQQQITLTPDQDTSLFEEGDLSNGGGVYLFSGRVQNGALRRALLRFPLGSIPPGSTITDVELQLSMSRTISSGQSTALHRLSGAWQAGTVDASGQEGTGAPAQDGDATWEFRVRPSQTWAQPGGDFAPTASATTTVIGFGDYTWQSSGMVADVQGWVDSPTSNFGWIVIGNEAAFGTAKRFNASEFSNAGEQPQLLVTFTPVDPPVGPPVVGIPTLSQWALLLLVATIALVTWRVGLRRA